MNRLTPLMLAAKNGDSQQVEKIVQSSTADVNEKDSLDRTALMLAANGGHEVAARVLLEAGADSQISIGSFSLLDCVIKNGDKKMVGLFLRQAPHSTFPLHLASFFGHAHLVGPMLELGYPIEDRNLQGETPMHVAASSGSVEMVEALACRGAKISPRNSKGQTPSDLAKERERRLKNTPNVSEALRKRETADFMAVMTALANQ